MYVPSLFAEDRPEELEAIINSCSLPILVSPLKDAEGVRLTATHLPLMLDGQRLVGHIARANKQWQLLDTTVESMAIFSGVDGYVSPSFYATKQETGRVVPTWNYEAVHAYGRLEVIQDTAKILEVVTRLTNKYEGVRAEAVESFRCPGRLCRHPVKKHRGTGAAHHQADRCAQAESEQDAGGPGRGHRRRNPR